MKKKIISILLVASLMAGNMGDLSGMQVKAAPAYTYEPDFIWHMRAAIIR